MAAIQLIDLCMAKMERAIRRSPYHYAGAIAIAALVLITIALVSLSANCATGGSCDFANGDFANWLFPKVKAIELVFWKIFPG